MINVCGSGELPPIIALAGVCNHHTHHTHTHTQVKIWHSQISKINCYKLFFFIKMKIFFD